MLPDAKACRDTLSRGGDGFKDILTTTLDRIAQESDLNAFTHVLDAAQIDQAISVAQDKPLAGMIIAHKDNLLTNDLPTSCGSKMLEGFQAPVDATCVARLRAAGAVNVGKTNMDEFGMGSSTEFSAFGATKNPWSLSCVPGGSSGGAAAAVAAGLVHAATATDTGGSIRQPAAFCGVSGFKPSYGMVSRFGLVAYASSLDQAGVIAGSIADLAPVAQVMMGHDPQDATSLDAIYPDLSAACNEPPKPTRVGKLMQWFGKGVNRAVAGCVEEAIQQLSNDQVEISEVDIEELALAVNAYYILAPAECSSNLARYDGVRFGHRVSAPDLPQMIAKSRSAYLGSEVQRRILMGTHALSSAHYNAYYLRAQKIRRLVCDAFDKAFSKADFLIGPTTPTVAFRLGEKSNNPAEMYQADINTVAANLAGLPAVSVPCGFVDGMPVGLQIVGRFGADAELIAFANRFQQNTDWHSRRPEGFA